MSPTAYNTGQHFRYNDRGRGSNDPDLETSTMEDGSRHTKWMKPAPRLQMMKAMLKPGHYASASTKRTVSLG